MYTLSQTKKSTPNATQRERERGRERERLQQAEGVEPLISKEVQGLKYRRRLHSLWLPKRRLWISEHCHVSLLCYLTGFYHLHQRKLGNLVTTTCIIKRGNFSEGTKPTEEVEELPRYKTNKQYSAYQCSTFTKTKVQITVYCWITSQSFRSTATQQL